MKTNNAISVLLLDDNPDLVRMYKQQLERLGPFRVTPETDGRRAFLVAQRQLFDVLVVDAKLDYRGVEFGGLRLADELRPRYGTNAILIISRFITADLMREYGADYEFVEKGGLECVCRKICEMWKRQYVFVAMPFGGDIDRIYRAHIKKGVQQAGLKCVRVDEIPHTRPIPEVVFEAVEKSKLVVLVADGANANAYYEAGFADAMRKEVVIVARSVQELKFDVAQRHTIFYGDRPCSLEKTLTRKISLLRLAKPVVI